MATRATKIRGSKIKIRKDHVYLLLLKLPIFKTQRNLPGYPLFEYQMTVVNPKYKFLQQDQRDRLKQNAMAVK